MTCEYQGYLLSVLKIDDCILVENTRLMKQH